VQLTKWREAAGFFLAQAVSIAAANLLAVCGFYLWLYRAGGVAMRPLWSIIIGTLIILAVLPVFLLFRAWFGGVPPLVSAAGKERAFTSSGAEIGAYILAGLLNGIVFDLFLWDLVYRYAYVPLQANGNAGVILSLTVSPTVVLIFFLVFIGLRRGFSVPKHTRQCSRPRQRPL